MAHRPHLIERIFNTENSQVGFHSLNLFVNGQPKCLVIDDKVPCFNDEPAYVKPQGKNLWPCLLEKAWAKLSQNYGSKALLPPIYPF